MALTALQVKNAKPGDKLSDGGGLRLDVDHVSNKTWIFRFTSPVKRKERYMGIGPARDVSLSDAREAAQEARALIRDGKDPIEHRKEKRAEAAVEVSRSITFREYAERHISGKESGWKNPKHPQQWRNTLRDYAYPIIGDLPVADIDTPAVLNVLRPIWDAKKETARRVRGRIEAILSTAKAEGRRTGENPALWRGHLDQLLSKRRKFEIEHHAALPYDEMPKFWKSLVTDPSDAARMLRFIILTACRYTEAAGVNASEISGALWTIPAARMKAERNTKRRSRRRRWNSCHSGPYLTCR